MEQNVLRMLDGMISTDRRPRRSCRSSSTTRWRPRATRSGCAQRLEAHGASPSTVRAGGRHPRRAREDAARHGPRREGGPQRARRLRDRAHGDRRATSCLKRIAAARGRRRDRRPRATRSSRRSSHDGDDDRARTGTSSPSSRCARGGRHDPRPRGKRRFYCNQGARKRSISFEPRGLSRRAATACPRATTSVGVSSIAELRPGGPAAPPGDRVVAGTSRGCAGAAAPARCSPRCAGTCPTGSNGSTRAPAWLSSVSNAQPP